MCPAIAEQGVPAFEAAQPLLAHLLKAETAEREVRAVAYQLKQARSPVYRDLAGFEFAHSEVNEVLVRQLHLGDSMGQAENVVLVGGPGTGKTHPAMTIGVQAAAFNPSEPGIAMVDETQVPTRHFGIAVSGTA